MILYLHATSNLCLIITCNNISKKGKKKREVLIDDCAEQFVKKNELDYTEAFI